MNAPTTSVMIFVTDKDGRFLLVPDKDRWRTFYRQTGREVIIRKAACDELERWNVLTFTECLVFQGIFENGNESIFVYTTDDFATNQPVPSPGLTWYTKDDIPFQSIPSQEMIILNMIINHVPIGIPHCSVAA